jgi:signal peptidase I
MIQEAHLQSACCDLVVDVVRSAGSASLRAMGCSMLPAIRPGDVLAVERHNSDELQPGEIILYNRNGKLTAHRIIQVLDESLLTQGDSLPSRDLPVQFGEVVGRVIGICRNGRPVSLQRSPWQSVLAAILRRSELCTRLYLRLSSRVGLNVPGMVTAALKGDC